MFIKVYRNEKRQPCKIVLNDKEKGIVDREYDVDLSGYNSGEISTLNESYEYYTLIEKELN